jgi:hypothetical protein
MANPNPPPGLHNIVPHKVTKGEINIAHAPQSSPACAAKAPVANLFGDLLGFPPLNKRLPLQVRQRVSLLQGRSTAE